MAWSADWANTPPIADAGADQEADAGVELTFDGSGSSDPDGTISSWDWDFGDTTTASGEIVTKTYDTDNTYTVTLTVTDDNGATDTDTCTVTITKPTVSGTVTSRSGIPLTGATVTIDGNTDTTDDAGGYSIDILNGTYTITAEYPLFKTTSQALVMAGDMTQDLTLYKVETIRKFASRGASLEGGTGCGRGRRKY